MKCTVDIFGWNDEICTEKANIATACLIVVQDKAEEAIKEKARRILESGCRFFMACGEAAVAAEELIDEVILEGEDLDVATVALDDGLEDAVEFAVHAAFPGEDALRLIILWCGEFPDDWVLEMKKIFGKVRGSCEIEWVHR